MDSNTITTSQTTLCCGCAISHYVDGRSDDSVHFEGVEEAGDLKLKAAADRQTVSK